MEHSLVAEVRVLARNLEHWENLIEDSISTANAESVKRWKIGLESDINEALKAMVEHFKLLERVRTPKPKRGRPKSSTNKPKSAKTRVTRSRK